MTYTMFEWLRKRLKYFVFIALILSCAWIGMANFFGLGPFIFIDNAVRVLGASVFA